MLQKLLVPLDGTPQAASALPPARALARAVGASLVLLRVVAEDNRHGAGGVDPVVEAEDNLTRVAAELRSGSTLAVETAVRRGNPAQRIVEEVLARGVDLVVMATHGRSGLPRAVLGSVAERVLVHSPVPVVLYRPGGKRVTAIATILVPVDGSPGGALALSAAATLARATGAQLVVLQVAVPILTALTDNAAGALLYAYDPAWDEEVLAAAQQYVGSLATRLQASGLRAEGRVVSGQVVQMVDETADEVDADLVVMSTHALTGPVRTLLGSVADAVVRTGRHPVLLVKRETAGRLAQPAAQPVGAVEP
jgi:nucleotide-binding universal stress UspA family protein